MPLTGNMINITVSYATGCVKLSLKHNRETQIKITVIGLVNNYLVVNNKTTCNSTWDHIVHH